MTYQRPAGLILALLCSAFVAARAPAATPPRSGIHRCEIDYSLIPDSGPLSRLTDAEAASLQKFREMNLQDPSFLKSFQSLTDQVVRVATSEEARPLRFSFQTALGGYRGRTGSSIAAQTTLEKITDRDDLQRIAAAIGYVYLQDSVMVHCRADVNETGSTVRTYDITERRGANIINPKLLKSIYGVLIGEADGDITVGFSYYPKEDRISVIEPDGSSYSTIIENSVRNLGRIMRERNHFVVRQHRRWLTVPNNNWKNSPYGEEYVQRHRLQNIKPGLDRLQAKFLEMVTSKFAKLTVKSAP